MTTFLIIGLVFSPLAAIMAFIITVMEYSHHLPDKRAVVLTGLQAAVVTFIVFVALALGAGWFFQRMALLNP